MSTALRGSGRNILYSICNWGADAVWTWGAGVVNIPDGTSKDKSELTPSRETAGELAATYQTLGGKILTRWIKAMRY